MCNSCCRDVAPVANTQRGILSNENSTLIRKHIFFFSPSNRLIFSENTNFILPVVLTMSFVNSPLEDPRVFLTDEGKVEPGITTTITTLKQVIIGRVSHRRVKNTCGTMLFQSCDIHSKNNRSGLLWSTESRATPEPPCWAVGRL